MKRCDSALSQIEPPNDYSFWLNVSMSYKAAGGDIENWVSWCKRGSNAISENEALIKWDSFSLDGGISDGLLYKTALAAGWQDPERGADRQTVKQTSEKITVNPAALPAAAADAIAKYIERCAADRGAAVDYMASRGIDRQTMERFNIGWDAARKAVVIPYPWARSPYYIRRYADVEPGGKGRRYDYPAESEAGAKQLFNIPALHGAADYIFVTEGQINAISIEQHGGAAVGVNDSDLLLDEIKRIGGTDKRFLIIPDNDKTGMEKAKKVLEKLIGAESVAYIYNIPGEYNDSNEYLMADEAGFNLWVNEAAERTKTDGSGAALIDSWVKQWDSGKDIAISTGFENLDNLLDGGLYPGLYTVGAISSLGKTTFVLQMADQIAAAGNDILFIALEQSAAEITAKTISRLTAQISQERCKEWYNAQTVRSITSREKRKIWQQMESQRETVTAAVDRYKQTIGKNMFIKEGIGNIGTDQIRRYIKDHINRRGKLPILVIDYVQIIAAYGERLTDKQNMDRNIVELKRISRDYNIPVIGISSFNRSSYTGKVDLSAFKESGAVEYTSDVIIGLQPEGMKNGESDKVISENKKTIENCKNATLRNIEAVVLKSRNGGIGTVNFDYRTLFNLYEDRGRVDLSEFKVKGQPIGAGGGQHF